MDGTLEMPPPQRFNKMLNDILYKIIDDNLLSITKLMLE